jgi:hypothetical protein
VQEVIDFVLGGNVLREPFRPEQFTDFPTKVITSLEGVERFRFGYHPDAAIHKDCTWHDMKMRDAAFLGEERYKICDYWHRVIEPELQAAYDAIHEHLSKQLGSVIPPREINEMAGQLLMAMAARALLGHNDCFEEKLFRAYKAFGYPCGWSGDENNGALVVFSLEQGNDQTQQWPPSCRATNFQKLTQQRPSAAALGSASVRLHTCSKTQPQADQATDESKTMNFGEHTVEVQEVIDFVLGGNVLREPFRPEQFTDFPTKVITSLEGVERFRSAYDHTHAEIRTKLTWFEMRNTDILHIIWSRSDWFLQAMGKGIPELREIPTAGDIIREQLARQLGSVIPARELEEIAANLDAVMIARALLGYNDSFAEKLFRAYKAFGHPCGWSGNEETGALVVFSLEVAS